MINSLLTYLKTNYRRRDVLNISMIASAYILFAKIALTYFSADGVISIVWPSSGLGLTALLLGGRRYWLAVFLGSFIANLWVTHINYKVAFVIAFGDTLEPLLAVTLLESLKLFDNGINKHSDYLQLTLAAVLSACVGAIIGNLALIINQLELLNSVGSNLFNWWLGDLLGIILFTPLALVWRYLPVHWLTKRTLLETVSCFGLALLCGQIVFLDLLITSTISGYWLFVFVAWAAIRYGRHGVLLITSIVLIQGLISVLQHKGHFGTLEMQQGLFDFCCYMLVLNAVGINLALVIKKRDSIEKALRISQQRLLTAQHIARLAHWEWNISQDKVFWSREACCLFGLSLHAQISNSAVFFQKVHPDDHQFIRDVISYISRPRKLYTLNYRIYLPNDELRYLQSQLKIVSNPQGDTIITGTIQDITERKLNNNNALPTNYQNNNEAIVICNDKNIIIAANEAFCRMSGYSEHELLTQPAHSLSLHYQNANFYNDMYSVLKATGQWQGELCSLHKTGKIRAEWLSINTIFNDDGSVYRYVLSYYNTLHKQYNFDPLTELPNNYTFHNRLKYALDRSNYRQQQLMLLLLNLDGFKKINALGYSFGDALLSEVATRLLSCLRQTDTVARLNGDEFAIITTELNDIKNAEIIVQRIFNKLLEPFYIGGKTLTISASVGIAIYPNDADNSDKLMQYAHHALITAKKQGHNQYCYFTANIEELNQVSADLRNALINQQFFMYYQPIIDLSAGTIAKAEAFIRWQHPKRGLINPDAFIPVAKESGLVSEIDAWVFEEVLAQLVRWRGKYAPDFQISINKSPCQLNTKNILAAQLIDSGLNENSIVLKITEDMLLDAGEIVEKKLTAFRNAHIQVSLEDFDMGYYALAYLKRFDINYLKINQSFVRSLKADSQKMTLCQTIIAMAHKLDIKVIAEGIETEEQLGILRGFGCDYGQGYLFAKPMPANQFERLFDDKPSYLL